MRSTARTTVDIGRPVPLERLLGGIDVLRAQGDTAAAIVRGITLDSRQVAPGTLFCCVPGKRTDGHDHAAAAVAGGASALLCERFVEVPTAVPQVLVRSVREAMAPVAAAFYDHPSRRLSVAGVTGTNGKTTTTHLLASVLAAAGRPAEVIGTLTGVHTTPEAPELQRQLADMAAAGTTAVAMEVSSEALAQHRADATWFEVAAFTNLSQDHLNFHGTMEAYFDAKASLFDPARAGVAVINSDGPWGRRLADLAQARGMRVRTVTAAEAVGLRVDQHGSTFTWDGVRVRLRLPAAFNVGNALTAAAVAREMGVSSGAVAEGLGAVTSVPGRLEPVGGGIPFRVFVDYAHTPAALESVLGAARQVAGPGGRVLVVFGAGGDRDHDKRPAMGDVATRLADVAILTTDNPRSEDPLAIIDEVRSGVWLPERLVVEPDRRQAIRAAVEAAGPGDVVIIAGKGHERTQTFAAGRTAAFDDREVAREELARR